jgi:hypothetical protein
MNDFRLCEECGYTKPTMLFAKFSLTCKMCMHQMGMQNAIQRRKRKDESSLDNNLCKKFLQQHTIKPTGLEMTLI